jgi:hypothetical protein
MSWTFDERLAPFLRVTSIDDGEFFAGHLFRRKYGVPPPTFGRHVVALHRRDESTFRVASYVHMWTQGTIGLLGGACTDGRVLREMPPQELQLVNESGGLLRQTLRYCFTRFADEVEAFFGHCGDPRALEVVFDAGFSPSGLPHLIVRFPRELSAARQQELIRQAHAIGPF